MQGPKSYAPSIENGHGQPIEHWMTQLDPVEALTRLEQVAP